MTSYILTYYRLRKRKPVIALAAATGGPSFLHPQYHSAVEGGGDIFEYTGTAEMVP